MLDRTAHVVGRGIIGLSLAYELTKRGWRVFVVGPKTCPGAASWAAVGVSSMKGQTRAKKPLFAVKMYGHEGMPAWIAEVQAKSGRKIRHRFAGLFEPFSSPKEFDWIRERVFHKEFTGCVNVELVPRSAFEARGLPPGSTRDDWQGAFLYPNDGFVHPEDLLNALETALLRGGATFVESAVRRIAPQEDDTMLLETHGQSLTSRATVIAAGIFSNEILRASGLAGLEQQAVPGETLVAHAEGPDRDVAVRVGKVNYIRSGSEIRTGSTPFDGISGDLESVCREAFGEAKNPVQIGGTRGRFRDRLPAAGQIFFPGRRIGPWVSIGYYKNGIQLAHLFAQFLASSLEGEPIPPRFQPFLASRFDAFSAPRS